jgi:hypothetical protein
MSHYFDIKTTTDFASAGEDRHIQWHFTKLLNATKEEYKVSFIFIFCGMIFLLILVYSILQ